MATTTPNFGWPVPTSTDLVKDGATAMEALGDAIDTSMVDLKGGTTGQVLAKASNTDMDFSWVAQDDSNAIQNSIVNAKGDLIGASANDTPAILSVGNNGETLVADSSTATGLRYTAGTVQSNPVLNSAFQLWQRGTSFAITTPVYTADRWQAGRGANDTGSTFTRQTTNDTTNLPNIQYCIRGARNSGNTSTQALYLSQSLETVNSIPYAGKTVTVSFYARAGANYSASANALILRFFTGTGTDQNVLTAGYTGSSQTATTFTLTTTWQRFNVTISIPSTTTEMGYFFDFSPTGTAGANDFFEMTGTQIDVGSVALPFRTYAGTIQGELAACQRYFYKAVTGVNTPGWMCAYYTSSTIVSTIRFPVTMRTSPTFAVATGTDYYIVVAGGGNDGLNTLIQEVGTPDAATIYNNTQASGTIGYGGNLISNNASASLAWSAEL